MQMHIHVLEVEHLKDQQQPPPIPGPKEVRFINGKIFVYVLAIRVGDQPWRCVCVNTTLPVHRGVLYWFDYWFVLRDFKGKKWRLFKSLLSLSVTYLHECIGSDRDAFIVFPWDFIIHILLILLHFRELFTSTFCLF